MYGIIRIAFHVLVVLEVVRNSNKRKDKEANKESSIESLCYTFVHDSVGSRPPIDLHLE